MPVKTATTPGVKKTQQKAKPAKKHVKKGNNKARAAQTKTKAPPKNTGS